MKTTKHNLNAIALGVALAMGSVSALATPAPLPLPVNPSGEGLNSAAKAERASEFATFESAERTGLALVESSLSLIAGRTHVDPIFCSAKTYTLSVNANDGNVGTATINDTAGGTVVLAGALDESNPLGAFFKAKTTNPLPTLFGAGIVGYAADHEWSRLNNIFLDHAIWTFIHPVSGRPIPYDEHSIKDYYKRVEDGPLQVDGPESWEYDFGFEVITKEFLPVAKWTELSWYRQQDGNDGIVKVKKDLLSPKTNKALCRIVFRGTGFSPFEYSGTVQVYQP
ncbi:MAG: hypothetical protein PHF31_02285 [Methylobacter sp.]|nr:hypothetical protein [Methylobacter sp.]